MSTSQETEQEDPQFAETEPRETMSSSFRDGRYHNSQDIPMNGPPGNILQNLLRFFRDREIRRPARPLTVLRDGASKLREQEGIVWLGHSSALMNIGGCTILTDPVLRNRAGPLSWLGFRRFFNENPVSWEELDGLDVVLLSHDHFDHLDRLTIRALRKKAKHFVCPLGVGSHLRNWGIEDSKITEIDWGEEFTFRELTVTCTPTQHFSGRRPSTFFTTLWCSWVLSSDKRKVFFGSDSGYFPGFKAIGEKYGPFDLCMLECGAYSEHWPDIHMLPEQNVQANQDLGGKLIMPIHWAGFALSFHPWTEPVERLLAAAGEETPVATPRIGEFFSFDGPVPQERWWEEYLD